MTIIRKRKSEVFFLLYEINSLSHSGIKGMRWGRRRYQNEDGSLTPLGRSHYGVGYDGYAGRESVKKHLKREIKTDRYIRKQRRLRDQALEDLDNPNSQAYRIASDMIGTTGGRYSMGDFRSNTRSYYNAKRMQAERMRDRNNIYVDKISDDYRSRYSYNPLDNRYGKRLHLLEGIESIGTKHDPEFYNYDRRIERAYNQSFAKAQRKWEKQQARRQFASSIASIAGQRLADYAVDAAVGAVSKQLNKAILDNKPSKGGYDYRQDVINTKKSLKSHLKDTVSSGKRVMTEAKLAPSYKNLYNRLKASGRVSSFNQFLNEVYYPDLERRR